MLFNGENDVCIASLLLTYVACIAHKALMADALAQLYIKGAMGRTVRKALFLIIVHQVAISPPPALSTDTSARNTKAMIRTRRVLAVDCNGE